MAIGLEIEVPVPINKLVRNIHIQKIMDAIRDFDQLGALGRDLNAGEIAALQGKGYGTIIDKTQENKVAAWQGLIRNTVKGICSKAGPGRVDYGTIREKRGGFRVDADHDDRVLPPAPAPFPPLEGGYDSIMEIVMDPPAANMTEFTQTMANIKQFTQTIDTKTNSFKKLWLPYQDDAEKGGTPTNPWTTGIKVGSLNYESLGGHYTAARQARHGYAGSIQVNIGIDLRAYANLVDWYVKSTYSDPTRAVLAEQPLYTAIREDLQNAVKIGTKFTDDLRKSFTPAQIQATGNLLGLQGWFTHLALYLLRGKRSPDMGGTAKNLAPVLLKSPNNVATTYGWTAAELTYYQNNTLKIVQELIKRTGRPERVRQPTDLNNINTFPNTTGVFRSLADLVNPVGTNVALTGKPLNNPTVVGSKRKGSTEVESIPHVPGTGDDYNRGGIVVEFRTLPGFYDGPDEWENLGKAFLTRANTLNQLPGFINEWSSSFAMTAGYTSSQFHFNYALSTEPVLLNGMKVIFDQPVSVYPVTLESKEEARRNGK